MLAASTNGSSSFNFDDQDSEWPSRPTGFIHNRSTSIGSSWQVTSIGRGFDWNKGEVDVDEDSVEEGEESSSDSEDTMPYASPKGPSLSVLGPVLTNARPNVVTLEPLSISPTSVLPPTMSHPHSRGPSRPGSRPITPALPFPSMVSPISQSAVGRTPPSPVIRPRRRSSQQRVSLFAGRVSITPAEPPAEPHAVPPVPPPKFVRSGSTASYLSSASSVCAPSASEESTPTVETAGRTISEFAVQGEIGRGAYGLVKKAREILPDGNLGPPLVIKQVIKSRILADCWKKHPKFGTIPIEIYVMSSISNTSYVLPARRPWDPSRLSPAQHTSPASSESFVWEEGKIVKGHPNICPLLDFFEDTNYYYLVLPSSVPEAAPNQPVPPSDLFDLVEAYPEGLPPHLIRTYLGQMADALSFLHSKGIVHRDIKDENVVLGANDRSILIDFGSSGLVKKGGWDTFSGTLDYAGPEILRGEHYEGKAQDVWAYGVVAYVLLVGECPFTTAAEAQEGLVSPFSNASIALDERCHADETFGEEADGGGALMDAAALVRACLQLEVSDRPTFDRIMESRFLSGGEGWTGDDY
ncbi:unnamed protein product [Peniophora sp. CBMAI 1063]|nr:unnamed protein product [Peniophora sp. CBMAI 1063]